MANEFEPIMRPELVFGIAGAIGIDIEGINRTLTEALAAVRYESVLIRITEEIDKEVTNVPTPDETDFGSEISYKMSHASAVCRKYGSPDTLMRFAINAIRRHRAKKADPGNDEPAEEQVRAGTAYIVRQLKRPEEVELLRKVYGKQFVLISAYGSAEDRKRVIEKALRRGLPLDRQDHQISARAEELIHRDQNEGSDKHGQHLRDTFHLADVFIDGNAKDKMSAMIGRFIDAFFGRADILRRVGNMECMQPSPLRFAQAIFPGKSVQLFLHQKVS